MRRLELAFVAGVVLAASLTAPSNAGSPTSSLQIKVLSNRADLISGNDALVEIVVPRGARTKDLRVNVGGRDQSKAFAPRSGLQGRVIGRIDGLALGRNRVTARLGTTGAEIVVTNHPIGGPVFSGPQIQPWSCAAGAMDKQCNRAPSYTFVYKPSAPGNCLWLLGNVNGCDFRTYDPANPPSASGIAQTTTDQGVTVPYIVRVETGTINRDQYRIAVLIDPAKKWEPWAPQKSWNHKVVVRGGAGCGVGFAEADAGDVLQDTALSRGFAVVGHALANTGHNCSVVTEAESLMMTKERLIERYGEIRYTIGSGCSGGSIVQQQVSNAYPGIYDGITPQCSYPDFSHRATWVIDYALLARYFNDPTLWAPGVAWPFTDQIPVNGNPYPPQGNTTLFDPTGGGSCAGVPAERVYQAETNPKGVRCSYQDYAVSVFGSRPRGAWGPVERNLGRGFANRPLDNIGIQYGLKALMAGKITPAQFVDLNAKVGSFDIDVNWQPARMEADRSSLPIAYRSGAVNAASHLDKVPILDIRGTSEGYHEGYRSYVVRSRLDREVGSHDNHVLWRAPIPLQGDLRFADDAIVAMDKWLSAIEKDKRNIPIARKIIQNKPASLIDRCTNGAGADIPTGICDALIRVDTSPRIEAGMPFTDDAMKCQLKPLRRSGYLPILFTDDEWSTLRKTFPSGVCDYTRPGVGYQKTVAWMTYEGGPGGQALPPPPRSREL